ncbi:NlpC/P60 family protein [Nakamurella sp. GG22]
MRTHHSRYSLRAFRTSSAILLSAVVLGMGAALPAAAEPAPAAPAAPAPAAPAPAAPNTAEEAKQAWLDAARRSEAYNEQVLAAEAAVTAAKKDAAAAGAKVKAAADRTAGEQRKVAEADAVVASYQRKVDSFANASFQGARLTDLSVLLTAASPEDYLDQASSLSQVATDQQNTLTGALAARTAADKARATAQSAQDQAERAKKAADKATTDAQAARVALDTGKAKLDKEIAGYQLAYARLSTADISAAVAGAEAANLDAAAQTRQAEQAAQRDRSGLADDVAPVATGPEFSAWAARHAPSTQAGIAVEAALSRQGLPYVWAAEGPDSFDCSSLMMWAWRQAGVEIPRNSAAQADALPEIPLDQLQPGDLVTFYSPVSHVGMYVGDGKVLHASMPGVPIKVVPLAAAGPNPTGHKVNR